MNIEKKYSHYLVLRKQPVALPKASMQQKVDDKKTFSCANQEETNIFVNLYMRAITESSDKKIQAS